MAAMLSITVRGVGVEAKGSQLVTVFTLSEAPVAEWIHYFRERARYSVFDAHNGTFRQNRLRVELPRREDLEQMINSIERFIEGANLDLEFRHPS